MTEGPIDKELYRKQTECNRIFEFLIRLNSEFELSRVQILSKDDLPSLSQVYPKVQGEESRSDAAAISWLEKEQPLWRPKPMETRAKNNAGQMGYYWVLCAWDILLIRN